VSFFMADDLETQTEKPVKTFKCAVSMHRELNPHAHDLNYCRNYSPGRETCQYRGRNIPYQTSPGSVGGRAYQCKCQH